MADRRYYEAAPKYMDETKCDTCPLIFCDVMNPLCGQTAEFKLEKYREIKHQSLPMYYGSGRWDRSKQRKGIRRILAEQV